MSKLQTLRAGNASHSRGNLIFRFFTHPLVLLSSWALVLINGEHTGGPYLLYLFPGFPKPFAYAFFGYGTILVLLVSEIFIKRTSYEFGYPMLNLFGAVLSFISISAFFIGDSSGYNFGTFYEPVSLTTVAVYLVILILFNYRYMKILS